jgi:hypothetical protein
VKRQRYFDWEQALHFIWQGADQDGIWNGDASTLATEFDVSEDAGAEVLDQLRARRLIEKLYTGVQLAGEGRSGSTRSIACASSPPMFLWNLSAGRKRG